VKLSLFGIAMLALSCPHEWRLTPPVAVTGAIETRIQDRADRIALRELTDFEWDRVFVFGPYTTSEAITKTVGVELPELAGYHLDESDSIQVIVFLNNGKDVRNEAVNRGKFEFAPEALASPFTPSTAVFRVTHHRSQILLVREKLRNLLGSQNVVPRVLPSQEDLLQLDDESWEGEIEWNHGRHHVAISFVASAEGQARFTDRRSIQLFKGSSRSKGLPWRRCAETRPSVSRRSAFLYSHSMSARSPILKMVGARSRSIARMTQTDSSTCISRSGRLIRS
jgi:hypothetical protein